MSSGAICFSDYPASEGGAGIVDPAARMATTDISVRARAIVLVVTAVLVGCGTQKADESGPVDAGTITKLEALLHARADAMGRGDLKAFTDTIDTTRPAFRRMQQRMFELPNDFVSLQSSFKISGAERYKGYVRAFVQMTLEGNGYFGVFAGMQEESRLYFREVSGRWILTEPIGAETGDEKSRAAGDATTVYWSMDDDIADVFARDVTDAQTWAAKQAPKPASFKVQIAFVPTAELAGPGWDATVGWNYKGAGEGVYAAWYGLDESRAHVSAYAQFALRTIALDRMRDAMFPGAGSTGSRLSNDVWLDKGWGLFVTGLDFTAVLRQSCAGIPIPTLRQLSAGPPRLGEPGASAETYARAYAYSQSMVAYLFDRFGPEAYWRLLDAYVSKGASASTFAAALNTSQDDFYAAWLTWQKKKYC